MKYNQKGARDWTLPFADPDAKQVIKEKTAIRVKYDEIIPYTGPKTIGRVMYLLHHSRNERKWTRVLHDITNEIRLRKRKAYQRLIMVEIVETLNSK